MRLPDENFARLSVLALALALGGCGVLGGGDRPAVSAKDASSGVARVAQGPAADYPMVLGEPFIIDGIEYTPEDRLNFDEVGYATTDPEGGATASHKTLPLPSYVEVTSLETGKTILVRVERRGPMTGARVIGLGLGAQEQLGAADGTPVRVRRVNPPENERAALRAGQSASERLETPMSLVAVLKRKLPAVGSVSLTNKAEDTKPTPSFSDVFPDQVESVAQTQPDAKPPTIAVANVALTPTGEELSTPEKEDAPKPVVTSGIVIQAATFSSESNAKKAAQSIDGFVVQAGRYFRVRTGPYPDRGKADAALAKVKAAGYSDARVIDAG